MLFSNSRLQGLGPRVQGAVARGTRRSLENPIIKEVLLGGLGLGFGVQGLRICIIQKLHRHVRELLIFIDIKDGVVVFLGGPG